MIFLRKSLQVAIKILTEAGHVLMDLKQMMLIPLFKFMVLAVFLVFWVTVSVYLIAGAKLQNTNDTATGSDGNGGTTTAQVFEIVADNQLYGFMVYHFFCLLWTMALIKVRSTRYTVHGTWYTMRGTWYTWERGDISHYLLVVLYKVGNDPPRH